jgi:hypothetical protein
MQTSGQFSRNFQVKLVELFALHRIIKMIKLCMQQTALFYTETLHKYLMHMHQELMRALSIRLKNWCVH